MQTLGQRLKESMALCGYTPAKLAKESGVSRQYVYNLLNDTSKKPDISVLEKVYQCFDVSRRWFMSGRGEPYEHELIHSLSLVETVVNFVINSQVAGSKDCNVPDLFSQNNHSVEQYKFFYFPEVDECFPANTLVVVERAPRPGPGLFLICDNSDERRSVLTTAIRRDNGFQVTFDLPENHTVLGRIRHMLHYRLD